MLRGLLACRLPPGYIGVMALEAVIAEALKLSAEERTELVARLLDSLDDNADPGHEAAWTEVIDRRMKDITEERVELDDALSLIAETPRTWPLWPGRPNMHRRVLTKIHTRLSIPLREGRSSS